MSYVGKSPIDRILGLSQKNVFTGDGSTTSFDMTSAAPEGGDTAVDVLVDNVRQEPGTGKAYVLASDGSAFKRITFSTAPASGAVIWTNNRLRTQITNILPGAGTVGKTLINDDILTGQTAVTTLASADTFMVYDDSASAMKKVAYSNIHTTVAPTTRTATGDGSTTGFTVTSGRTVDNVLVFLNGVCQVPTTDYTISSTTLTFTTAPVSADAIQIREL